MRIGPRSLATLTRLAAFALALGACEKPKPADSAAEIDDFGRHVPRAVARRIVSLSPSTTEILFAIGAGPRVVGRTRWDSYPDSARAVPDLGDGIRPNVEAVLATHPDLVLLYASNDNRPASDRLEAAGVRTLSLKNDRIESFSRAVRLIGAATGDSVRAAAVVDSVQRTLLAVRRATANLTRPRVFWHVWTSPVFTIGGGSYLDQLLDYAGATNVYHDSPQPSPQVSLEDVARLNPDIVIAGPEGAARIRNDPKWRSIPAVAAGHIVVVDTGLVGRPAIRLGEAAASLARLLHPNVVLGPRP
ncbi:MAG: helical backbone metal receptor [Gemmatimonadota bacterium]|nr:helical backbone metal receptor [Gemmatimonadota bacterium]